MTRILIILLLAAVPVCVRGSGPPSIACADPGSVAGPAGTAASSPSPAVLLADQRAPEAASRAFVPVIDPIAGRVFDAARVSPTTCPAGVAAPSPGFRQACGMSPLDPAALQIVVDLHTDMISRLDVASWRKSASGRLSEWLCGDVLYQVVVRQSGPPTLIEVVWGMVRFP